jgi:RecB family exonuclease
MLERFYFNPYPARIEQDVAIERVVKWQRPRRNIELSGKMDRVCLLPDKVLEVIDYKTCRRIPTADGVAAEAQTFFYRTLAAEAFPNVKFDSIRITYLYLLESTALSVEPNRDAQRAAWEAVAETGARIKQAGRNYASGARLHEAFVPNRGSGCRNCEMRLHCDARFPMPVARAS